MQAMECVLTCGDKNSLNSNGAFAFKALNWVAGAVRDGREEITHDLGICVPCVFQKDIIIPGGRVIAQVAIAVCKAKAEVSCVFKIATPHTVWIQ